MQAVLDWVVAHWELLLAPLVYEIWSLIPAETVASSSILTLIGGLISTFKPKPPQLK